MLQNSLNMFIIRQTILMRKEQQEEFFDSIKNAFSSFLISTETKKIVTLHFVFILRVNCEMFFGLKT